MPDDDEHGIGGAFYTRDASGLVPVLECLCGWSTYPEGTSWEEAGAALDDHLAEQEEE
jgi:hypothetical protein